MNSAPDGLMGSIHCEGETNTLTAGLAAAVIVKVYQLYLQIFVITS